METFATHFITFSLPEQLRPYFGLRPVLASDVGITHVGQRAVRPDQLIYPRLAVMPMGWSHAAWWCQKIHMTIVSRVEGVDAQHYMHDAESPPAAAAGGHTQYLDNCMCYLIGMHFGSLCLGSRKGAIFVQCDASIPALYSLSACGDRITLHQ